MEAQKKKRKELRQELALLEKQIFDLETTYLDETREFGNIFTGWKAYLSADKVKSKKQITLEERLFSLSSISSPASRLSEKRKAAEGGTDKEKLKKKK